MTLVELIVSLCVMVMVILGIGFVFSRTSNAVQITTEASAINSNIRSLQTYLYEDIYAAPSGGMVMINPDDTELSDILVIFRNGLFNSVCHVDADGSPVSANAAMVIYYIATSTKGERILCRNAYLLAGRGDFPADMKQLREEQEAAVASDINLLDNTDILGGTLPEIHRLVLDNRFKYYYLEDIIACIHGCDGLGQPVVNLSPQSIDDPARGGVMQMWPLLACGVEGFELRFCDGLDDSATMPSGQLNWLAADNSSAAVKNRLRHSGGLSEYNRRAILRMSIGTVSNSVAYWMFEDASKMPDAIEVTLKMSRSRSESPPREVRLVCPVK